MNSAKLIQQTEHYVWVSSHMINIRDSKVDWNGSFENKDCYDIGIGVATGVVGLTDFSRAAGLTPIFIEVYDNDPGTNDLKDYTGVMQTSLTITSDKIYVESIDTNNIKVAIQKGNYCVRVYYGNDNTGVYDNSDGANHARIILFPDNTINKIKILKAKKNSDEPVKKYKGPKNETELMAMLTSPIISYRCIATVALCQLGKLESIQDQLSDAPLAVKRIFASAVWFAGKKAVPVIQELAKSKDNDVRLRVAQSSSFLKSSNLKDLLVKLAKDKNEDVSEAAEYALDEINS